MIIRLFKLLCLCVFSASLFAIEPIVFVDEDEEKRFRELTAELRCLVCQNQNIADSNAGLAIDLKNISLEQIREGKTDAQIKDFLVQRYGDFVLYEPQFKSSTWLLWLGPFGVVLIGGIGIWLTIRKRAGNTESLIPDPDQEQLDKALENGDWE